MLLIGWLVAHWKIVLAAVVAIVFFSYRVRNISQEPLKEREHEEGEDDAMSHGASKQEKLPQSAQGAQPPDAGATASPQAATTDSVPLMSSSNDQIPPVPGEHPPEGDVATVLDDITSLFASRNPKHALQGVSDAVRNVVTGVGLGMAGIAAGTYGGAKEDGWKGMAKGFGAGACGLIGLTGYGLYSGVRQVVRGVGNTPEAVSEVSRGEAYWDSSLQQWVRVDLEQDFGALPNTDDDLMAEARKAYAKAEKDGTLPTMAGSAPPTPSMETGEGGAPSAAPADPAGGAPQGEGAAPVLADAATAEPADYYAFLGVEKTASTAEIRKAYTRKALEMHPDKNPSDANATLRFQNLNKIYSVLSNEETRAAYDRYGTVDSQSVPDVANNPMKEMLGAAFLEPLVGQLHFFLVFESGVLLTSEMQRELHRRRRLRVTKNLVAWLDNGSIGLEAAALAMRDAVSTALGPVLVSYVAEQYHLSSRQQLYSSTWAREVDSWYSSWAMSASTLWHWTSTGARTARRALYDKDFAEKDILRVLGVVVESDVKHVVLQACRLLLYDTSVTPEKRHERAVGLGKLSEMAMTEVKLEIASRERAAQEEKLLEDGNDKVPSS
ncbi:hypothetical protein ABL78_0541 [Leptomonas seymouri]|uniref:J domain-containing protein n=1 Tax=Leptomonas seymouri TaxID=5684 RepID=A0A0N1IBU7_LEPSE|nr:hypothetical protein ABL78_0541 [Leptomonas seymouri]|eukprot:KPI90314.1 hypothetical protein ABL78_0541 [Leptomonas seymouri]